jgi:hypothetical protein
LLRVVVVATTNRESSLTGVAEPIRVTALSSSTRSSFTC